MKKRILKRLKNSKGASATIEMIFIILLLFLVATTVMDIGIYFNNRYTITNAAQNGARLAAVFGGTESNAVSQTYGINTVSQDCLDIGVNNPVACSVVQEIKNGTKPVAITVTSVECGPNKTTKIGDRTWCNVKFIYHGLPAGTFAAIRHEHTVQMTAESEVVWK